MPELPEVETISRQLQVVLPGKVIRRVEVLREKSWRGQASRVVGKTVEGVSRKQKIIEIDLGDTVLLVHLKMTGQLIFSPTTNSNFQVSISNFQTQKQRIVGGHPTVDWVGELPSKHTRVIFHFSDNSTLFFNDQRVFGWVKEATRVEWLRLRENMAPDVVDTSFTVDYLTQVLKRSRRPVKLVILDQDNIGGMGNIYANDALFLARIHPLTPANQLTVAAVKRLHQAMKQVITKGIETGGSSISHFVDSYGIGGHYQDHFLVYDRVGEACDVCGSLIIKTVVGGRGTYFCPRCQRKR